MFISNRCVTRALVSNQTILNHLKQHIQLRRTGGVHVCNHGTTPPLEQNGIDLLSQILLSCATRKTNYNKN